MPSGLPRVLRNQSACSAGLRGSRFPADRQRHQVLRKTKLCVPSKSITSGIPRPNAQLLYGCGSAVIQSKRYSSKNSMDTSSMGTSLLRKTEFVEERGGTQVEQVFVRSQAVVSRRVAGETLVVPVRGKVGDLASIYSFNQTGSLIWQSLESPKGFAELVNVVEQEYAVVHDQAQQDVKQFLHDMLSADLIQVVYERVCGEAGEEILMAGMDLTAQAGLHAH